MKTDSIVEKKKKKKKKKKTSILYKNIEQN